MANAQTQEPGTFAVALMVGFFSVMLTISAWCAVTFYRVIVVLLRGLFTRRG